jgi:hypothetical protein
VRQHGRRVVAHVSNHRSGGCDSDSSGQKLAYVYFEDEPGRRSAAKLLSETARLNVSLRAFAALGEGEKPQGASGEARGGGRLGSLIKGTPMSKPR